MKKINLKKINLSSSQSKSEKEIQNNPKSNSGNQQNSQPASLDAQKTTQIDQEKTTTSSHQSQPTDTPQQAATAVDDQAQISQNQNSDQLHVKPVNFQKKSSLMKKIQKNKLIVICVIALIAGSATGFGAYQLQSQAGQRKEPIQQVPGDRIQAGDVFGAQEDEIFTDEAQGYLEAGGINGEGSHKLLRVGGPSQTVYLTSSVTNLDKLIDMEVKVWGETYKGQIAGWLMDVGKVEVINPDAEPPLQEDF